ncbi:MAG: alpha/beta fold hydrolase [Terriglobia bacterium]
MSAQDRVREKLYRKVPREQRERLFQFRATHPSRHLTVAGVDWDYIACGRGGETLLLPAGGLAVGETAFQTILALENEYRIIAPTYPGVKTMGELVAGILGLLEAEGVARVHILGGSYGGLVAQCVVHARPERVEKLILSHTVAPNPERVKRMKKGLRVVRLLPFALLRPLLELRLSKLLSALRSAGHAEQEFWRAYIREIITTHMSKEVLLCLSERVLDYDQNCRFTRAALASWAGKVLLIESDDDPAIKAADREALRALYPQARVHTFHQTGHAAAILKREEYISLIKEFLRDA